MTKRYKAHKHKFTKEEKKAYAKRHARMRHAIQEDRNARLNATWHPPARNPRAAGGGYYPARLTDNRTDMDKLLDEHHDRRYAETMMMREEDYIGAYVGTALKKRRIDNYWHY